VTARLEIAIPRVAAWCRKADDPIVREFADHLADHLAASYRAEPDHKARDEALRQAAGLFFAEATSKNRRAELLAAQIGQYRSSPDWRERDRFASVNPYTSGVRRYWLWRILAAVDRAPAANSIRNIIG
jgi:hypothetical protein